MNNRLSIPEIAGLLSEYAGVEKKKAERFLKEFVSVARDAVFEKKILKVKGIGTFKVIEVKDRESVDVNTGNRIVIPGHYKFSFTPDKELKEDVNKPFSFFETVEINDHIDIKDLEQAADTEPVETEIIPAENSKPEEIEEIEELPVIPEESSPENEDSVVEEPPVIEEPEPVEEPITEPEEPEKEILAESIADVEEPEEIIPEEDKRPGYFIPKVENREEVITEQKIPEKPGNKQKIAWIAAIAILLIGGGTFFFLNRYPLNAWNRSNIDLQEAADSIVYNLVNEMLMEPDSTLVEEDIQEDIIAQPMIDETADETPQKEVIATVKIKPGNRLTLLALEYYGEKVFWVYLYEYNKESIKDPNNVPVGTEIAIPSPELYNINSNSKASLEKAALLQSQILSNL